MMLRPMWRLSRSRGGRLFSTQPPSETSTQLGRDVSIQGLQGDLDNDPRFTIWLHNCQRWGLGDCQQKVHDVKTGKKTIDQLFREQEELLKSIAETSNYKFENNDAGLVSPQGIQGDDCDRYQLWLRNCQQFGFGNCGQQLNDVREGKKTLAQIFAEQDDVIKLAAAKWKEKERKEPRLLDESSPVVLSRKEALKRAVRDYGSTVIVFHVVLSLASLGSFYTMVSSGVDVLALLRYINVGEAFIESKLAAGASTFVLAYAVHKLFAPARIAITLTCVPFIVRYLRRINVLKKPPSPSSS